MLRGRCEPGSEALGMRAPAGTLSVWWGAQGTPCQHTNQGGLPGGEGAGSQGSGGLLARPLPPSLVPWGHLCTGQGTPTDGRGATVQGGQTDRRLDVGTSSHVPVGEFLRLPEPGSEPDTGLRKPSSPIPRRPQPHTHPALASEPLPWPGEDTR